MKCLNMSEPVFPQEWFILAEDSVKLFPGTNIKQFLERIRSVPDGVEILQTGYRKTSGNRPMKLLDLNTMRYMDDIRPQKMTRIIGQKLLLVTRKGAALIHRRLLMGHQTYYDNCIL